MNQITHHSTAPVFAEIDATSISAFTDRFMKSMKDKTILTEKGVEYKDSTIRQYKMFYDYLIKFETLHDKKFEFNEINYQFGKAFQLFLTSFDLTLNSVSNILKKFKAIMGIAMKKGISYWGGSGLKTITERAPKIYLTLEDLSKMNRAELTPSEEVIRDIFFIQCWTAMRTETIQKYLKNPAAYVKEYNGKSFISIISDKTGQESSVPLGKTVSDIIQKYNGKIPIFSERQINRVIKVIGKKAGIDNLVPTRITRGNKVEEELVPKYSQICSHTGRRTLISLMKQQKDISISEIITISGHASQQQMEKYDHSSGADKIKNLLGHSFFDTQF